MKRGPDNRKSPHRLETSRKMLSYLIPSLLCLVPVIGIVVTAMARRTHGRAAIIGMLGCVALLLSALAQVGQAILLASMSPRDGYTVIAVMSLLMTVLSLTGISLLIWGVVARRPAAQPQPPAWQPYGQQPSSPQPYAQQPSARSRTHSSPAARSRTATARRPTAAWTAAAGAAAIWSAAPAAVRRSGLTRRKCGSVN